MPNPPLIYFLSLLFFFSSTSLFLILPSNAQVDNSTSSSSSSAAAAAAACKNTLYPKLCRSITSSIRYSPSDPYNYGKISIKQCLKQARKLSQVINHFLQKQRNSLTHIEANALEDCYELSQLSVGYFDSIGEELKVAETLNEELVDRVETLLSAIVTNQQTCVDGLMTLGNGILHSALAAPLSNATKLYSVSLGLVTNALARNIKKKFKKRKGSHQDGSSRKGHPFREPLDTLIKALHKSSCKTSKACKRVERVLGETEGNGILISDTVIVSQNGTDNFTTIGDAIAIAPNNSKPEDGYFVIYAREGYYEEYIVIPRNKKNILLLGDGINQTIITGNHSYVDGWTTYNSSTFAVAGERFIAIDMTFRNTAGPTKHQAVAVRNNADISTFYRCSFEGYQDTLYVHSLRQFYRECDIYGTVDFIFGNAAAVFQNCNLYARKPLPNQKNAFTAQGRTDPNQNTGISIHNCSIEAAPDLAMDLNSTLTYLGRPWKVYSRTVIMQSYIGEVINPVGWLEWNGTVGLDTLYYGEFENFGPRANTSTRVQWPGYNLMNVSQAVNFTVYNLTLGDTWLPYTDIPFNAGLLH